MEYYIIRDDRIGRTIAEILIRKARAGLEVRVIYDAVGSWRLSRKTLRRMHDAGVETAAFEPIRFPSLTTRVTHRNHRKIVVTDGKVAYLGGINIAKYYLDGDYMGQWRDEHLRVEGNRRGRPATALHRRLAARTRRIPRQPPLHRPARHPAAAADPAGLGRGGALALRPVSPTPSTSAIVRAHRTVRISSPYFLPLPCCSTRSGWQRAAGCGYR